LLAAEEMEYTGERVIPDAMTASDPVLAEHLARYAFASERLPPGARVLDAACGSGYGTRALAEKAGQVVGVDLVPEAVAYARGRYGTSSVAFATMDCRRLAFRDGAFDAYICFETLEHVQQQETLVAEARRVLTDGGFFLVSTPNREVYNLAYGCNAHHERELSPGEFESLLRRYFDDVTLFGQCAPGPAGETLRQQLAAARQSLPSGAEALAATLALLHARLDRLEQKVDRWIETSSRAEERLNHLGLSLLRSLVPARLRALVPRRFKERLWPGGVGPDDRCQMTDVSRKSHPSLLTSDICHLSSALPDIVERVPDDAVYLIALCRRVGAG
jgi:ubiquinone/menaquinone biosynthesis C-methylase UbiE